MILKEIHHQLCELNAQVFRMNSLLDRLIKRITSTHNQAHKPFAWLGVDNADKARALRDYDPELYKYVCAILDLYLGSDDKTCECDKQCKKGK